MFTCHGLAATLEVYHIVKDNLSFKLLASASVKLAGDIVRCVMRLIANQELDFGS